MALLLAGGRSDPNLEALARSATAHDVPLCDLRAAPDHIPVVSVDPQTRGMTLGGIAVIPKAAFLRPDVFTEGGGPTYKPTVAAQLSLVRGWLASSPQVSAFNPDPFGRSLSVNKGAALAAAATLGFSIPITRIGNDHAALGALVQTERLIQKPVTGGDHCRPLTADQLARSSKIPPVIAQSRIDGPDLRVFRVGDAFVSFELRSVELDYREDKRPTIAPTRAPDALLPKLRTLTDQMGLTWSASDFKLCPDRGPVYLETNANPMFAGFDKAANGALCREMLHALGLIPEPGAA